MLAGLVVSVIYLTMSMSMSSLSVILSVLVEKLHFSFPDQQPLPRWAKVNSL